MVQSLSAAGAALAKLFDPYDVKARLFPGLLVLIPAIAFILLNWGSEHPAVASLASLLMFCGGPYALASFVRTWGQRAQERLHSRWGGQPTTILLRHRDSRLPAPTKITYHELIQVKLRVTMPNASAEAANEAEADAAYKGAADALRPLTNDHKKFPFVFKELVAYGFNRNAYGVRWVGVTTCLLACVATLMKAGVLSLHDPYLRLSPMEQMSLPSGVVLLLSLVLLAAWLLHFTPKTVEQAGYSYALRLFEALLVLPRPKQANVPGSSPSRKKKV